MKIFHGRVARVRCLAFSPDGTTLYSAGNRGLVRLWDAQEGRVRARFRAGYDRVLGLTLSPDGSRIASTSGLEGVQIWSADGTKIDYLQERNLAVYSIEFRPVGLELLASGWATSRRGYRGIAVLWSLATRKVVASFKTPGTISTSAFSRDGTLIALGTIQSGILLWDPVRHPDGMAIYHDAEHPRDPNDPVKHWVLPHKLEPQCLRFSPDVRLLAASAGWSIQLYDVREGLRLATLKGHQQMVKSLDFSPDGRILASASHDGTVRFWDPETGDERASFDWDLGAVNCAVFAPDGMTIAVGGEGGIVVWDVE